MKKEDLQIIADLLIKAHKNEITRDKDCWFGTSDHDFNIHDGERNNGWYTINVYPYSEETGTDYSTWITLPFVRIKRV
jgi:hypothetical protein